MNGYPATRELDTSEVSVRQSALGLKDWFHYDHREEQSDNRDDGLSVKVNTHTNVSICFCDLRDRCYFLPGLLIMNALTTIAFGCTPTGIMVRSEYSVGSSLRGRRFWITVTSPACVSSTSR